MVTLAYKDRLECLAAAVLREKLEGTVPLVLLVHLDPQGHLERDWLMTLLL